MTMPGGMELATFLSSTILAGIMTLVGKIVDNKNKQEELRHQRDVEVFGMRRGSTVEAREFVQKGKTTGFHRTRRIIAVLVVFFVVCWPMIVPVFRPDIPVTVSYSEFVPSNIFSADKDVIKWVVAEGIVVTPAINLYLAAVFGLFFGNQMIARIR